MPRDAQSAAAIAWIEPAAAVLGPLLLLATGIAMVLDGPWRFADPWVVIGLAGFAGALGLGAGFQGPGGRRWQRVVRERGPSDPEAIAVARRLNALMWPELGILLVVLLAMATKPAGGEAGFWAATAAILVAAGVLLVRGLRAAGGARRG